MLALINSPPAPPPYLQMLEWFYSKLKVVIRHFSATCIGPLGMESGVIGDNQIQASSSFEHASVGPHNARSDEALIML